MRTFMLIASAIGIIFGPYFFVSDLTLGRVAWAFMVFLSWILYITIFYFWWRWGPVHKKKEVVHHLCPHGYENWDECPDCGH